MRLQGKVAIITGGASGIGRASAVLFAKEGASVVVASRGVQRGAEVVAEITANGGRAVFVATDVTKMVDCRRMVQTALDTYGKLDILYLSAATSVHGTILTTSEEEWDNVLRVNLTGTYLCCKCAVPAMIANGGGSIITSTSAVGWMQGMPNRSAYAASKGGVTLLTRCMACDFVKDNIRVNTIAPGPVDTPMMRGSMTDEQIAAYARQMPVGRLGQPEEVAYAAVWLASDESTFVTGAVIPIDGGRTMTLPQFI
jgi:NAD(P)-dependent dehydrogenase (short-subunit alcohol dehydrogenase family)